MGIGVNTTDPLAATVHGTNPQYLVEKITRTKIYASLYWKEFCFGLTADALVDRAMELKYFGGTHGGQRKPTNFMCLVLKMLQLQPEKEIIIEFIKNEEFKYVRVLGAFYLRLVGRPVDIYKYLELLYNDYRKLRHRTTQGWEVIRVDEFIDELLTSDYSCDIALPRLPKRWHLEQSGLLPPRMSLAAADLDDDDDEDDEEEGEGGARYKEDDDEERGGGDVVGKPVQGGHMRAEEQRRDVEEEDEVKEDGEMESGADRDHRRRHRDGDRSRDRDSQRVSA